jgi:hypothetical protein
MRRADCLVAVAVLAAALAFPVSSSSEQKPAAPVRKGSASRPIPPKPESKPPAAAAMSREQMRDFLLTAEVISFKEIGKGVTRPKRLTLTKNGVTHDAAFQSVDEQKQSNQTGNSIELNFVDAYRYNLAAYAIAGLLDLEHMMPMYVERKWRGKTGSISWWVETMMDEGERLQKKIEPPNSRLWNEQMFRMRAFAALIHDTDRNMGNVLITPDWKVMMIDFTRAFRRRTELVYVKDLGRIDKALLAKLEQLSKDSVKQAVGDDLTSIEINAIMDRRDRMLVHFQKLIAEKGSAAVLY